MFFNPDPKKPAHEVIFSKKKKKELIHPSVFYNNVEVSRTDFQKHLGLLLDNKQFLKNIIRINWIKLTLVLVR